MESIEFDKESVKLFMGEVTTPFHTLKLDMATERHRVEQVISTKLEERASHVSGRLQTLLFHFHPLYQQAS